RAADRVIAISRATRDDLVRYAGVRPDKVTVIYHGLAERFRPVAEPARIAAARARYGIGERYFLYLGTVQPRKNLERLIVAFAQVLTGLNVETSERSNLQLVIAGKPGWLTEAIERRAAELGVAGRVVFTGYVPDEDVPALLSGALAFVFPSLYEGFGMPVLE